MLQSSPHCTILLVEMHGRSHLLGEVGQRVRALREARGLTQRTPADRSGVSPRYLAQLEAGDANISVERLADVCRVLGSTPAAILEGRAAHHNGTNGEHKALHSSIELLLAERDAGELR